MQTPDVRKIMLAVGPDGSRPTTLAFTVDEARRRGCGVHVVHVVHTLFGEPIDSSRVRDFDEALSKAGRSVLVDLAIGLERELGPGVSVSTELAFGPVVRSLVERSGEACLVVIEPRSPSVLERLVTASVTNGVAATSAAPVVCVPAGASGVAVSPPVVVVGVEEPRYSVAEVRAALAAAASVGGRLRVVHAWYVAEHYEDLLLGGQSRAHWAVRLEEHLREGLAPLLAGFPEVEVDVVIEHARPADALVEESVDRHLMVLARRHPTVPIGSHLGPVARTVLHQARCPVLVVEPEAAAVE